MTAPTKPKRITWRTWWPESLPEPKAHELLTRDDLVQELHHRGAELPANTLRQWERRGVLPRPEVRSFRGTVQSTYPPQWPDLVEGAWNERQRGTREDIVRLMVAHKLASSAAFGLDIPPPLQHEQEAVEAAIRAFADVFRAQGWKGSDRITGGRFVLFDDAGNEWHEHEFGIVAGDQ